MTSPPPEFTRTKQGPPLPDGAAAAKARPGSDSNSRWRDHPHDTLPHAARFRPTSRLDGPRLGQRAGRGTVARHCGFFRGDARPPLTESTAAARRPPIPACACHRAHNPRTPHGRSQPVLASLTAEAPGDAGHRQIMRIAVNTLAAARGLTPPWPIGLLADAARSISKLLDDFAAWGTQELGALREQLLASATRSAAGASYTPVPAVKAPAIFLPALGCS